MVDEARVFEIEKYDKTRTWPAPAESDLKWHAPDAPPFRLAGFAWFQSERVYRRLPLKPEHRLPEAVDSLANCTAGGQIAFSTNSTRLALRIELLGPHHGDNMTAIGQCGFDCYLSDGAPARYYSSARFDRALAKWDSWLFENLPRANRAVTINFPLYQGVRSVQIGLDANAQLSAAPPYASNKPVVVYGTSITQGGAASRPGMLYTNILSRRFNVPFVNLGFSGSGLAEPELAHVITEIADPALLVLDYDSNIRATADLKTRTPEFIRILRATHRSVPILLLSKPPFMTETVHREVVEYRLARRDFLRDTVKQLRDSGDAQIHFFDGSDLYGDGWDEMTVDGRHCSDLGFLRIADALTPVIKRLLS